MPNNKYPASSICRDSEGPEIYERPADTLIPNPVVSNVVMTGVATCHAASPSPAQLPHHPPNSTVCVESGPLNHQMSRPRKCQQATSPGGWPQLGNYVLWPFCRTLMPTPSNSPYSLHPADPKASQKRTVSVEEGRSLLALLLLTTPSMSQKTHRQHHFRASTKVFLPMGQLLRPHRYRTRRDITLSLIVHMSRRNRRP